MHLSLPQFQQISLTVGALTLALCAGWLDWRSRRIPNWLTIPGLLLALVLSTLTGWSGLKLSLEGAGLALGLLLPFVLARGLGAGDWKLMGALGAFLRPYPFLAVLLGTVFIAGIMAVVQLVRQHRVKETLSNLWVLIVAYSTFRIDVAREITLDNPALMKLPFGVAAALATTLFYVTIVAVQLFRS